jgi:hypothetical protein
MATLEAGEGLDRPWERPAPGIGPGVTAPTCGLPEWPGHGGGGG